MKDWSVDGLSNCFISLERDMFSCSEKRLRFIAAANEEAGFSLSPDNLIDLSMACSISSVTGRWQAKRNLALNRLEELALYPNPLRSDAK